MQIMKTVLGIGGGSGGRGPGPHFFHFFRGALVYEFISTTIPLHECIGNLIGLPSKLKPRKALKSRDVFFKSLLVGRGKQKLEARIVILKPTCIELDPCGQAECGL